MHAEVKEVKVKHNGTCFKRHLDQKALKGYRMVTFLFYHTQSSLTMD